VDDQVGFARLGQVDAWIDRLPDGVIVCTRDGEVALANDTMVRMSGYAHDELVGMPIDGLVPARHRRGHGALRTKFVEAGATRPMGPGLQLQLERRDGEMVPVEISLAPVGSGATGGVIAIVRDVTERRRAEDTLRTTSDLLSLASERERIARDLHDTVLQRLFGLGLELQAVSMRAEPSIGVRVERAVDEIDLIIREIRTAVFTLGSASREGSFGQELNDVVSQAKRVLGFAPRLRLDGPVESAITPEIRSELLSTTARACRRSSTRRRGTACATWPSGHTCSAGTARSCPVRSAAPSSDGGYRSPAEGSARHRDFGPRASRTSGPPHVDRSSAS
jgi:PAS domain S-box-containing protein